MLIACCAIGAAALLAPGAASASAGGAYGDYTQDGSIDGCQYSSSQLEDALGSVPTDVAQYDPRFLNQLNQALSERASGACDGSSAVAAAQKAGKRKATGAGDTPSPLGPSTAAADPAADHLSSDRGFPGALAVLVGLIALIIVGTALVAWRRERGPRRSHGPLGAISDYYWGIRDSIGR